VRKRRELNEHLDYAVGEDVDRMVELDRMVDEFVTSAKRMNIQPMTLVFKTNQLREIARKMLFRQFLSTYTKVLEEPTQEELEIIHKEVEKLCEIIYDVSFRTLIARDAMRAQAAKSKRGAEKGPSAPVRGGEGQPYVASKERPYYVN
jgi:adenylate kinase family enzyme